MAVEQGDDDKEEEEEETVNRLNPRYSSGVSSPGRHVRTRLYFTSESHIHSLLTVLTHGGLIKDKDDEQWTRALDYVSLVSELNYMTQIVIMLYEDPTKDPGSEERFHIELHFSPGVNCCVDKDLPPGPGFRPHSRNNEHSPALSKSAGDLFPRSPEPGSRKLRPMPSFRESEETSPVSEMPIKKNSEIPIRKKTPDCPVSEIPIRKKTPDVESMLDLNPMKEKPVSKRHEGGRPRSLENDTRDTVVVPRPETSSVGDRTEIKRGHRLSLPAPPGSKMTNYLRFLQELANRQTNNSMATQLFSTAVISGSSSVPNLQSTGSGDLRTDLSNPGIRPLETLHNCLSLHQLDSFLDNITNPAPGKDSISSPVRDYSPRSRQNSSTQLVS